MHSWLCALPTLTVSLPAEGHGISRAEPDLPAKSGGGPPERNRPDNRYHSQGGPPGPSKSHEEHI